MHAESKQKNVKFEQNLTRYGMMAVAAAAAAAPAQAGLIVWDPADVTTPVGGTVYFSMVSGQVGTTPLANWDFVLSHTRSIYSSFYGAWSTLWNRLYLADNTSNDFVLAGGSHVVRLGESVTVGPASPFGGNLYGTMARSTGGVPQGGAPWNGGGQGYIGLRFVFGGQTYYGWADVTVNSGYTATLNRFAYDNVAGTPVVTGQTGEVPEPGSMSLLILGAAGLAAYRRLRKRRAA
jgi:hypothetical protein